MIFDNEDIILTDNGKVVLSYMKENDKLFVGKDLIESTGVKGIYPVLRSLINKKLVVEGQPLIRDFTNNKGVTKPKEYKTYQLTDKGRAFELTK